jgi:hypothetical protein
MAYTDVAPAGVANGKTVVLAHGKSYWARYPEMTAVLALENPIGLEDYRSVIPPQPIETLFL